MSRRWVGATLGIIVCIVLVLGCGGGGEEAITDTGGMQISVVFPPLEQGVQPAVIYEETNSITVDILDPVTGDPVVPRTIVNRPSPQGGSVSVTITDIPVGNWVMIIAGWEQEDAGGKMLSEISEMIGISVGQTTEKSVVMDGWPYTLVLTASHNPILVDQTAQIFVTPYDVQGNEILRDFNYAFVSDKPNICQVVGNVGPLSAQVQPAGGTTGDATATAIARGIAEITATLLGEVVTGSVPEAAPAQATVTGSLDMTVDPNIDEVLVEPADCVIDIDETLELTATAKYQGNVVEDIDFAFSSSDDGIVSANETGDATADITGVSGGTADVLVSQPYTYAEATCEVTVPYGNANVIISETD